MPKYQLLALDTQVFTFLIQVNSGSYDPAEDTDLALSSERLAVFRVFMYYPGPILALPTVKREVSSIADPEWRRDHELFGKVLLLTGVPLPIQKVDALAAYYESRHPFIDDCRIVAESELSRVDFLLTYDLICSSTSLAGLDTYNLRNLLGSGPFSIFLEARNQTGCLICLIPSPQQPGGVGRDRALSDPAGNRLSDGYPAVVRLAQTRQIVLSVCTTSTQRCDVMNLR